MRNTYAGLFFVSFAALMLEILLTRVFSVATWYYFAFFAVSVGMFGFTVGARIVYQFNHYFPDEKLHERLAAFALLFAIAVDISLLLFLSIPFHPRPTGVGIFSTMVVFLAISSPFVCAGIVVCLCLTRFPKKIGLLYAADLMGAAAGAFMVFPVLNAMDAPTAIFLVGVVGALGALLFSSRSGNARLYKWSAATFFLLTFLVIINFLFQPFAVEWVKMKYNRPEDESWNAFSRIAVYPFKWVKEPYSWGLSTAFEPKKPIGERMIDIDGVSETVMTLYNGPESVEHLKYDITFIAHYLRKDAKVFVIGAGGGRDILASKVFNQKEVVGAEINDRILEMVNLKYGDFTGHLDKWPGVRLVSDEARSAITRMDEKFDIIQASCIATWSATTAGAFSLAENGLYTVEGWKIFFDHLTPDGILSFNRWYSTDYPAQLLRLASLASYVLKREGVKDPSSHIAIVRSETTGDRFTGYSAPSATILVSKSPFPDSDLSKLRRVTGELKFKLVFDPAGFRDPIFEKVINNAGDEGFHNSTELDISPPTDDRPFFFYMLRFKDLFQGKHLKFREQKFTLEGIAMLYILLGLSIALCVIFIVGPLYVMRKRAPLPKNMGLVGLPFFASIGFGYILIEMSQLQRLIIFLGHPIYSITVVLFSMLLASGAGAMASNLWIKRPRPSHVLIPMAILIGLITFMVYIQPSIFNSFEKTGIAGRVGISLLFLLPLGFFMGIPFPLGMEFAMARFKEHTPWFWAVNGATSVVSSVLSVCISIAWGFTATMKAGLLFYILAAVFLWLLYSIFHQDKGQTGA